MKRLFNIGVVAVMAAFLFVGGSALAASQKDNEAALKNAVSKCKQVGWAGDACQELQNLAKQNGSTGSTVEVAKGKTNSIYGDAVNNDQLIKAALACDTNSAKCINDHYKPATTTTTTTTTTSPPTPAGDCKDKGGVPVSSALGVPGNCLGSKDQNPIFALMSVILKFVTALFGLILVLMVVYSGIRYIISAGSPDEVKAAKEHLKGAATGLILFMIMYGLLSLIIPGFSNIFAS